MNILKKIGVFFLAIISILLIILLSLSISLNSFLYPEPYFEAFESSGLYSYLDTNFENAPDMFIKMPQGGSRELFENLFTNFLAYMRSDSNVLDLTVKIDQEKLRNFFLESVASLPDCNQGQNPLNEENPCLPQGQTPEEYLDLFLEFKGLNFFEEDTVNLADVYGIGEGSEGRQNIDEIRNGVKYFKLSSLLVAIIILVAWFLTFFLERPNNRKFLRVVGLTILISTAILYLAIKSISSLPNLVTIPDPIVISLVQTISSLLSSKLTTFTMISAIIGAVLFIASFFIGKQNSLAVKEKKQTKKNL